MKGGRGEDEQAKAASETSWPTLATQRSRGSVRTLEPRPSLRMEEVRTSCMHDDAAGREVGWDKREIRRGRRGFKRLLIRGKEIVERGKETEKGQQQAGPIKPYVDGSSWRRRTLHSTPIRSIPLDISTQPPSLSPPLPPLPPPLLQPPAEHLSIPPRLSRRPRPRPRSPPSASPALPPSDCPPTPSA
jgi:hypothetical protein